MSDSFLATPGGDPDLGHAGASPRGRALALLGILLVAGLLRFTALDFGGAGVAARPDEDAVDVAFAGITEGRLTPPLVLYGGGYFYPLFAFMDAVETVGLVATPEASPVTAAFARRKLARTWSAILSLATVAIVYLLGRRIGGHRCGLLAAAILAVSTLAVREAHFAKPDSAAAFAVALFLLVATRDFVTSWARTCAVGATLALVLSTKAGVDILPAAIVALAHPAGSPRRGISWRGLLAGGAAALFLTAALNQFWLTSPAATWSFARASLVALSSADWLPGHELVPGPFRYHAEISARYGCGLGAALLALPAVAYGLWRGGGSRLLAIACLGQWLKLLSSPMVLARFFLPLLPGLAVLLALTAVALTERLSSRRWLREAILAALALALVVEPAWRSITLVVRLAREDTRQLAGDWLARYVRPGAVIAVGGAPSSAQGGWSAPVVEGRRVRRVLPSDLSSLNWGGVLLWHSYPLAYSGVPLPAELRRQRSVAVFDPFVGDPAELVVEPLDAFYLPLAGLGNVERPGPRIEIYRLAPGWSAGIPLVEQR